jgi:hypothetical protein
MGIAVRVEQCLTTSIFEYPKSGVNSLYIQFVRELNENSTSLYNRGDLL